MSDPSTNPKTNNNSNEGSNNNNNNPNNKNNNDKKNDAVPGAEHDFRQNHTRPQPSYTSAAGATHSLRPPLPHELTAEWTVRAQLTFARAGERVQRKFSTNDPVNPVRVVYKWSTLDSTSENVQDGGIVILDDDVDDDEEDTSSTTLLSNKRNSSGRCSGQSTPLKRTSIKQSQQQQQQQQQRQQQRHESFRSTTSSTNADLGGGDSAFSSSNTSKKPAHKEKSELGADGGAASSGGLYGTRCRSTCNIVVSAVADFLPADVAAASPNNDNFMSANSSKTTNPAAFTSDFAQTEEPDPFVYNTTACYTVLPEKSFDDCASNASKNFASFGKILALRDAFSQTSDTETKYFQEKSRYSNSRSPIDRRTRWEDTQRRHLYYQQQHQHQHQQRKPYEHRRATTEALLQPSAAASVDEGDSFMPSCTPSPTQTFKSASLPRIPPLPGQQYPATIPTYQKQHPQQKLQSSKSNNSAEQQKKPRTVHIDVYCTGSDDDDEDQADGESSSSSSQDDEADASNRQELESNSTPQTVLNNEQMFLRHQRVTGPTLPRRIAQHQQPSQKPSAQQKASTNTTGQSDLNLGHAITKSSTAEEVSESKQLLFRKHIGDQRAAKLQNLRQKYMRQPSDDALSSNYPNSSRSTVRDATCSSISSAVPSTHTADYGDSSWKETDEHDDLNTTCTLAKSDSFEYENSVDRLRIKQMERFWSNRGAVSPEDTLRGHMHPTALQSIAEGNSHRNSPHTATPLFQRHDTLPSESENYSETDVFYTYPGPGRHMQPNAPAMQSVSPTHSQQDSQLQQSPHFMRNRPAFLHFFGPPTPSPEPIPPSITTTNPPATAPVISSQAHLLYPNYSQHLQRWKSETRDNLSEKATSPSAISSLRNSPQPGYLTTSTTPQRCGSEAPPSTFISSVLQSPLVARRFEMKQESPAVSEASSVVLGYTSEYLEKARKFGKVVSTTRKPGHHVGPTKNPNCLCESCQRWMAERFQLRSRAFSLGERPVLKRPPNGAD